MKLATICTLQMYGVCLIMLGLTALLGYFFQIPHLSSWGSDTTMSPASAVGFMTIGTSYFFLAHRLERSRFRNTD